MAKKWSRWSEGEARRVLGALAASGESVSELAAREGLEPQRVYRWRRRLGAVGASVPAVIELRPARRSELVEIVLASGVVLRVAEDVDAGAVGRLVAVLR